jgi:hypothetical protein
MRKNPLKKKNSRPKTSEKESSIPFWRDGSYKANSIAKDQYTLRNEKIQ